MKKNDVVIWYLNTVGINWYHKKFSILYSCGLPVIRNHSLHHCLRIPAGQVIEFSLARHLVHFADPVH